MAISLGELATQFGCDLNGDPETVIETVASLSNAGPGSLSFLSNSRLKQQLSTTRAAAVIVHPDDAADSPVATLLAADPYATYARIAAVIYPQPAVEPGVHASAVIEETAKVSGSAQIDALVYIGARTVISDNVHVGPGTIIGPDCVVGSDSRFVANVSLVRSVITGARCLFHPGVVIGADGFGNAMTPDGWVKVPQVGGVTVGDDVELGANTSVDCGTVDDTVVEDGVRLDNNCHIGHNVRVGAHTAMASNCSIAGSVVIGKRCLFAGKVGTVGHISICDDAMLSGRATVTKDITESGAYSSTFAAEKVGDWNRRVARFRRIESLYERVSKLEKGDK